MKPIDLLKPTARKASKSHFINELRAIYSNPEVFSIIYTRIGKNREG